MPAPAERTHEWVSFTDEHGDDWLFDVTFLLSNWTCIYGDGCLGVLTVPAPEDEQGCCSYGAHLADDADLERVTRFVERLDESNWQHIELSRSRGGPFKTQGGVTVSRLVDGACIFLNRPDFAGGAGCALHRGAIEAGERPIDWKPEVCWQLPLRLVVTEDENGRTTHTLREWGRRDWGEGGQEFHWWCTEGPEAFVGVQPAYVELRDEVEALVGTEMYRRLAAYLGDERSSVALPHPALKKRT